MTADEERGGERQSGTRVERADALGDQRAGCNDLKTQSSEKLRASLASRPEVPQPLRGATRERIDAIFERYLIASRVGVGVRGGPTEEAARVWVKAVIEEFDDGHTTIQMTARYAHVDASMLASAIARLSYRVSSGHQFGHQNGHQAPDPVDNRVGALEGAQRKTGSVDTKFVN